MDAVESSREDKSFYSIALKVYKNVSDTKMLLFSEMFAIHLISLSFLPAPDGKLGTHQWCGGIRCGAGRRTLSHRQICPDEGLKTAWFALFIILDK